MSYKCTRSDVRIMLHIISSAVAWQRTREDVDVICVVCFFGCNGFWNTGTERFDIFTIFKLFGYFQFHHWHPHPTPGPRTLYPLVNISAMYSATLTWYISDQDSGLSNVLRTPLTEKTREVQGSFFLKKYSATFCRYFYHFHFMHH